MFHAMPLNIWNPGGEQAVIRPFNESMQATGKAVVFYWVVGHWSEPRWRRLRNLSVGHTHAQVLIHHSSIFSFPLPTPHYVLQQEDMYHRH